MAEEKWCNKMAGRTTTDPKETTLKLRLNEEMRNFVEKSAKRKGITLSEYVRNLIQSDMRDKRREAI